MDLSGFLLAWRPTAVADREVSDALVHPAHAGPSPALAAALRDWPGSHYWSDEPHGRHLVLTRPLGRRRDAWALHLLLLAATLFTTTFVGAVLRGAIPFDPNPLALLLGTYPFPRDFIHAWATGLSFSAPLLAILLCHELGHFVTARRYQLDVSPPYFIPAPVVPWSIGTMGAFIRLRTVVSDRRQLLDVRVAGPIAGLLVAVPALVIGFALSHPAAGPASLNGMVLGLDDGQAVLGDSVLTFALRHLVRGSASALVLHPVAFAGWLGVFRSEEHTSELQSQFHLVCRLLLEKKKELIFLVLIAVLLVRPRGLMRSTSGPLGRATAVRYGTPNACSNEMKTCPGATPVRSATTP